MLKQVRNISLLSLGLSASALVGWLLLRDKKQNAEPGVVTIRSVGKDPQGEMGEIVLPLDDAEASEATVQPAKIDAEHDDLTRINGIGPRFAQGLYTIGVLTFEQLAQQNPEELAQKLAPYVSVRAQRISDNDWVGQAAQLAAE